MTDTTVVYENENYVVRIGKSIHKEDSSIDCYQIVNRKYNLIEAETTMLPSAIHTADDLNESLDELEAEDVGEEESVLTLQ